ncbi:MAG: hypothetical protein A2020_12665 [Lentisphaerae bacterium GWF2_45_14]|nr:MAG: hypothetical protein A2020_12665 [Lentisphaerae bacterium GWF2_45_14]
MHTKLGIPYWYHSLANYTFITSFIKLNSSEMAAIADDELSSPAASEIIRKLTFPMKSISGNAFVCVDSAAPTDTERFENKSGAVFSPESALMVLAESLKVRTSIMSGASSFICIRPFRRMNHSREFRLFIKDGKLVGMSQYWLNKYFRKLSGSSSVYWQMADDFINEIAWLLPLNTLVVDIYFTSGGEILIVDMNQWGLPVDPLLFISWDNDWASAGGIRLIAPPMRISGNVNVSF